VSLVAGCWLLVAGCWSLVAGRWLLVAGCWSLVAGRWTLAWLQAASSHNSSGDLESTKPRWWRCV
jgi:hypothetical protein